ncbi:MAG: aminotransferase class I/II-fold pyridoxal phosphate-dependent enzyme [Candidatus Omnitrophota bacterium]
MDTNVTELKKPTNEEKSKELIEQFSKLKKVNLWFYYGYFRPGKRAAEVYLDGKRYISFSTNNYLGLSKSPKVISAVIKAVKSYGVGTGASFAVTGGTLYHKMLQDALKDFYHYEDALLFSSGYMANGAVVTAFAEEGLKVFCDKYLHISFTRALKLHDIEPIEFEHNDVADLKQKIDSEFRQNPNAKSLIITESLFSQDGDIARIDLISQLAKQYKATLVVDDAHGLGTIGKHGYGILEYFNLSANDVPVLTGAMNKSLGSHGGYILSSRKIIELIKMKSYELVFTSSLPAMIMASACVSLNEIKTNLKLFKRLQSNIMYFRNALAKLDIPLPKEVTPIIPIIFGSAEETCRMSGLLRGKGIIAIPMIPPAVPRDASRIRFQITCGHTIADMNKVIQILKKEKVGGLALRA